MSFESLNKSIDILAEVASVTIPELEGTATEIANNATADVDRQATTIQTNTQITYDAQGIGDPTAQVQADAQQTIIIATSNTETAANEAIIKAAESIEASTESVIEVTGPGQEIKQREANAALSEAEAALSSAENTVESVTGDLDVQSAASNKVAEATQLVDTAKAEVAALLDNVGLSQLEDSADALIDKADAAATDVINGLSGGVGGGLSSLNELADPDVLLQTGIDVATEQLKGKVQSLVGDAIASVIGKVPGLPPILAEASIPTELGDLLPIGVEIPPLTLDSLIAAVPEEITGTVDELAEAKEQLQTQATEQISATVETAQTEVATVTSEVTDQIGSLTGGVTDQITTATSGVTSTIADLLG